MNNHYNLKKSRYTSIMWQMPLLLLLFGALLGYSCKKASQYPDVGKVEEPSSPSAPSTKKIKILFVGNSFSNNATAYVGKLAEENKDTIIIGRAELSSGSLEMHWQNHVNYLRDHSKGKVYLGKSLQELVQTEKWDIVSLQQVSNLSSDIGSFRPHLDSLINYFKKQQPSIRIVLHQTWAYRSDAKVFSKTEKGYAKSDKEMYDRLKYAYSSLAKQFDIRYVPVGDAFWAVSTSPDCKFLGDSNFNYANPVYPQLPNEVNSLHLGYYYNNDKAFLFDPNHCSSSGCYLGSLVWYRFLFKRQVLNLKYKPSNVPEELADRLRKYADQIVMAY